MAETETNDPESPPPAPNAEGGQPKDPPFPPIGYAWYVVGVLMIIYVFSFIDRQILSLLVGPIKRDLNISDFQMSLLMGFSFAVFYTVFGMPLGRLADNTSRRGIIAVGLALWSLMTAACGIVTQYWQFLMFRMGVGVGEAALGPSAFSLITDYFPKEKLATAISVYSTGIYIGAGLALIVGAQVVGVASGDDLYNLPIVGDTRPWQVVFFAVGLPGLLLTGLLLTVKEPYRRGLKRVRMADGSSQVTKVPISEVASYIGANRTTFILHNVGFALLSFSAYGAGAWIPEFMIRTHGWTAADIGNTYGAMVMILGTVGIISGGMIADLMSQRGVKAAKIWAGCIAATLWFPFGLTFPLAESSKIAVVALAGATFCSSMPFGTAAAGIQEIMPANMRAQASAIYLFVVNLIGLGLGPSAVAACTDWVFRDESKLNLSLLMVAGSAHVGSAVLLFLARKPYERSIDRLAAYTAAG
jgi:MFS family permease